MGADVRLVDEGIDIGIRKSWEDALQDVKAKGGKPYPIPAGASVHKFGGLGYVGFRRRSAEPGKRTRLQIRFHHCLHGDGFDHAGMLSVSPRMAVSAGDRHRASFTPAQTKAQVLDIARNTAKLVELGKEISEDDVVLFEDYAYPVYGVPSQETKEAIRLCARLEGMIIDPSMRATMIDRAW